MSDEMYPDTTYIQQITYSREMNGRRWPYRDDSSTTFISSSWDWIDPWIYGYIDLKIKMRFE